jgi:hypothetical protein
MLKPLTSNLVCHTDLTCSLDETQTHLLNPGELEPRVQIVNNLSTVLCIVAVVKQVLHDEFDKFDFEDFK